MMPYVLQTKNLKLLQILYSHQYTNWSLPEVRTLILSILNSQWEEGASEIFHAFTTEVVFLSAYGCDHN
jgi:hypothetical protein